MPGIYAQQCAVIVKRNYALFFSCHDIIKKINLVLSKC